MGEDNLSHRLALWLWLPMQVLLLASALAMVREQSLTYLQLWVLASAMGLAAGIVGITVAHELLHGRSRMERAMAHCLLLLVSYPHFALLHRHGHHRHLATLNDPATARLGENLYAFLWRSITGGLRFCWRVEARRLRCHGKSIWNPSNRLLQHAGQLFLIYVVVAAIAGLPGLLLFALQSAVSVFFLEAVNYMQHYGLLRARISRHRYEPVAPRHCWDSRHPVSNALLFNLGYHADHHCTPRRPYNALTNQADAPQLPAGYPTMFVIALFPPFWQWLMDNRVPQQISNASVQFATARLGENSLEEMIP